MSIDMPDVISADDHLVEPPSLWQDRLPMQFKETGPRVVRERGRVVFRDGLFVYESSDEGGWVDVWHYEDVRVPTLLNGSAVGYDLDDMETRAITFDDMRPGCYDPVERLKDMDVSGVEASVCFPNLFVRFAGQRFLWAKDKELAAFAIRAYNDFVLDEWCQPSGGRLIPMGIVPLWDPQLAAVEVHAMAARGMRAISFTEMPAYLDLPSVHSDHWEPLWQACSDTQTVVMIHIGSGSRMPSTAEDAPAAVANTLPAVNSAMSMVDWLFSGALIRHPGLKLCFAESQIGWIPYFLQRADQVWSHNRGWNQVWGKIPECPSTYFSDHIYSCFFSDPFGLKNIDSIGADNVLFETDYPHSDSNWPHSKRVGEEETAMLEPAIREKVLAGNARRLFRL